MKRCVYIVIIALLLFCSTNIAMGQSRNSLVIDEDHLVLNIDLQSSKSQIDSILKIAGIGIENADGIIRKDFSPLRTDGWGLIKNEDGLAQFSRSLAVLNENPQERPFLITTRIPQIDGRPGYPAKESSGINKYAKATVYELASGLTRFILPDNMLANRVFLSGSFNNWSTLRTPMKKTEGGWMVDIKLEPGAYEYKYIVAGHWETDPNNLVQVDDRAGNRNSVYYKYNHTFKLAGYANADKVTIAGNFNEGRQDEIFMEKKDGVWQRTMYLGDGAHFYRFYVDGKEITDPANPLKEKDEAQNVSSVLKLGETVYFKLYGHADARRVYLAGNFNNWKPADLVMKKEGGAWVLPMVLSAGNYNYKFIVDGNWITDPLNEHYAAEKGQENSTIPVKPNHTFKLKGYKKADHVVLAGDINKFDDHQYTMARDGDGWSISFYLAPGKYLYNFVVDGKRILDPGNGFWEPGESDQQNSVLWIE